jgi:O-antigen/teichoic acid export membrane protein
MSPVGELMKALGHPDWLLNWSVFFVVLSVPLLSVGSQWGMLGIGISLAMTYAIALIVNSAIASKLTQTRFSSIPRELVPSVVSSCLLAVVLWRILELSSESIVFNVIPATVLSVATYVILLKWLDRRFVSELYGKMVSVESKSRPEFL